MRRLGCGGRGSGKAVGGGGGSGQSWVQLSCRALATAPRRYGGGRGQVRRGARRVRMVSAPCGDARPSAALLRLLWDEAAALLPYVGGRPGGWACAVGRYR